jgi:predicted nucleotidyltransferase
METKHDQEHWKWRMKMARLLAASIDMEAWAVHAVYIIGSTKNASAGAGSDIDLLIHTGGNASQIAELKAYVMGWGHALAEINHLNTGYRTQNLIDLHLITDADIAAKTSYAVMIGRHTDGAKLLRKAGE